MINKIYDLTIDEIIEKYKKDLRKRDDLANAKESQFLFYSSDKKDRIAQGGVREFFVNLDSFAKELIQQSGLKNGIMVCSSKHTTSSIYVNHFEEGIMNDLLDYLSGQYPVGKKYQHNVWDNVYKNADAHFKAVHLGKSATVIIKDGEPILGDFENIIYAEFDYRKSKSINIALFGEGEEECTN